MSLNEVTLENYELDIYCLPEWSDKFFRENFEWEREEVRALVFEILTKIDSRDIDSFWNYINKEFSRHDIEWLKRIKEEILLKLK